MCTALTNPPTILPGALAMCTSSLHVRESVPTTESCGASSVFKRLEVWEFCVASCMKHMANMGDMAPLHMCIAQ
eukprot:CAMPEP_0202895402 /NCGR_PEP_ID=MMETSP1392-20130828/4609_1 /ASSEMBLY_ACC=CAM_ASM_000868 /TAXON_ID=225041 /ORGANISM="Chlamydomonas chlamydogama, Strain SAG 11-48b" /LENGTH=73 /DNA_ID=CAMNT_0049580409 /DNA_START=309 /DNA_END=530 /DNA_ORIENTATION=-